MIGVFASGMGIEAGASEGEVMLIAQFVNFPISLLIGAGILTALLPTTFGRAILVVLCEFGIFGQLLGQ